MSLVFFVMNITDIDDKIILRARRNYLFDKYKEEHRVVDAHVLCELKEAWSTYRTKLSQKLAEKKLSLQQLDKANKKELESEITLIEEKLSEAIKSEQEVTPLTEGDISLIDKVSLSHSHSYVSLSHSCFFSSFTHSHFHSHSHTLSSLSLSVCIYYVHNMYVYVYVCVGERATL
jgi:cysteinyl-tRNA synthetase